MGVLRWLVVVCKESIVNNSVTCRHVLEQLKRVFQRGLSAARALLSVPRPRLNNDSDHCKRRATSQGRAALGDFIESALSHLNKMSSSSDLRRRATLERLDQKIKQHEEELPIPPFFSRILGFIFTMAIIAAIRGVPPADQPATRRAA